MKDRINKITKPNNGIYLVFFVLSALVTVFLALYFDYEFALYLACGEALIILFLVIYGFFARKKRSRLVSECVESLVYDSDNARNNTLMNFPLPIAVFSLDDTCVFWGNKLFFDMCGISGTSIDLHISEIIPDFNGNWLLDGHSIYGYIIPLNGRKYHIFGSKIIDESKITLSESQFMGVCYWVDCTEYDDMRIKFLETRPVAGILVLDNLDVLCKKLPDRVKNDIRDAAEDKLREWAELHVGIIRRYDRDKYICVFEKKYFSQMKDDKFPIVEEMRTVQNPSGFSATISIGFCEDNDNLFEALQQADTSIELALSRGGDQIVIKNHDGYEFFGGRGHDVEKRTKIKSRIMANTLYELISSSSRVLVMSHKYADLDSVGSAVGVCCLAKKLDVDSAIVIDLDNNASEKLISMLRSDSYYADKFISPSKARTLIDKDTLLVIVDTNKPEHLESLEVFSLCPRVATIDHHRVSSANIKNSVMTYIEPYASSASELVGEMLQELAEKGDVSPVEANALLAGIVLDTKNFTVKTGDKTFDVASFLRRSGADTTVVKKLLQNDMTDTISKYKILQNAKLYKSIAIAVPEEKQRRIVAAQAADELLNISGVEASVVVAPGEMGGVFASARSIGELNVQIIMEKLGGGGNRSSAAVQFGNISIEEATELVYKAIDDYLS